MEKSYRNLGYFLLLLIPLTFFGFYKTYFNQFPTFSETAFFVQLHAGIAMIWILMLIIQPLMIRNKRVDLHRKIGKASYVIFPLLILSFIPQMISLAGSDRPKNLFFPLSDSILLISFYTLGIYYRSKAALHMRYMVGTALIFISPTVGRIFPFWFDFSDVLAQFVVYSILFLLLISLILMDKKNGRNPEPYLLMLPFWILHMIVFSIVFL